MTVTNGLAPLTAPARRRGFAARLGGVGRGSMGAAWALHYDRCHNARAREALAVLEREAGRRLDASVRRLALTYASDALGSPRHAPWLWVYAFLQGGLREGLMPDTFFGRCVAPRLNRGLGDMTDIKSFTARLLTTDALPDIGYRIGGVTWDRELMPVDAAALRRRAAGREVVLKSDGSRRGKGVRVVPVDQLDDDLLATFGDGVVQDAVRPHADLEAIVAGPVATVRLTTVREPAGTMALRAAYLRLGYAGSGWVRADRSLRVTLDGEGRLSGEAYAADWTRTTHHPDTGVAYAGREVPAFEEARALCLDLHRRVPHLGVVGWDVTVDQAGDVRLLEWNGGHCDIKFSEATSGPCFAGLNWERFRT